MLILKGKNDVDITSHVYYNRPCEHIRQMVGNYCIWECGMST